MAPFSAAELDDAFAQFQHTVAQVAVSRDWDRWADQFTVDAEYVEHAYGSFRGREEIRAWITTTMTSFPGSHMTEYPALWHVSDPSTSRVICEVDNPMRDPGDGLWSREEDVYNPLEFGRTAMRWCRRAAELGTLDDAARRWMETTGAMFAPRRRPESGSRS
ncbi:MAG: nuclear transport factor 2 family protein [Gordonia sp. (in: high G+C Gram-positive bacteria)]